MSGSFAAALANFHFLRPLALLLLLALPLMWLAWRHGRSDAGAWRAAVDAHLLVHLIERIDGGPGRAGIVLATAVWTLACIALAGPAWEREPMPLYRNQPARVLALELSPTMLAQDEKPSRLARARFKLNDILGRSRDYQTALIGYGADAFVAAPLTDDVGTVGNLVEALDPSTMPVAGNATARAIGAAADLIEQAGLHRGEIIVLADSVDADAAAAARKAHARGFVVSVLGIGTPAGAPVALARGDFLKDANGNVIVTKLDAAGLRAVASAGGGRYAALSADASDLDTLLATRSGDDAEEVHSSTQNEIAQSARWRDRGPWLLLALVPLALAGFRRGWLMLLALVLLAPMPEAQAASFKDLWQRPDQQAAIALAHGNAKRAAQVARSPAWRASAAYRAGDYKSALGDYEKTSGADGAYNKGNTLAKLGRYEDALAAYDQALKLAPDMADAKANRDAVENFLKQSKSKKDSDSQQKKQDNSKDSSQQGQKDSQQKSDQSQNPSESNDKSPQQGQQDDSKNQQGKPDSSSSPAEQKGAGDQANNDAQKNQQQAQAMEDQRKAAAGAEPTDKPQQDNASKPDAQQQQALSSEIDQALAGQPPPDAKGGKPQAVTPREDAATSEKKQALEHLLQRVPDDPGGLLRRKFQLEYQRRQNGGNSE